MVQPDTSSRALTYGRRKFIPLFVFPAVLAVHGLQVGRLVLFNVALLAWCVVWSWRYWVIPMTPRLAARMERRATEPKFGSVAWHKVAIGVAVALAALFVALIVMASLSPPQ